MGQVTDVRSSSPADASGLCHVDFPSPPMRHSHVFSSINVSATSPCRCTLYRASSGVPLPLEATSAGQGDYDSAPNFTLSSREYLHVLWDGCPPGTVGTATISYTEA